MQISLQTIVDLLLHATKESFCFDEAKIKTLKANKEKVFIGIVDNNYNDVEIQITLHFDYTETHQKINYCRVGISNLDGFTEISSFYANAVVEIETSIRTFLYGVEFLTTELEEVTK